MSSRKELVAALDIGSNSFRILVAETDGSIISPLFKDTQTVRLGEGMMPSKMLQDAAINRGLTALHKFTKALSKYTPLRIRACGTAALRVAENSSDFVTKAEKIINCEIEIISGEEEASLNLAGVLSTVSEKYLIPKLILDVGGGSTEIIQLANCDTAQKTVLPSNIQAESFPVGAINMTEKFLCKPGHEQDDLANLAKYLENIFLSSHIKMQASPSHDHNIGVRPIIASGGTATSIAALDLNLTEYKEELVQNHCLSNEAIDRILTKLLKLSHAERNQLAPLHHGRGDIILAGIQIHQTLMQLNCTNQLIISDAGFLEGVLISAGRQMS